MLVLSRRQGEELLIGGQVRVRVARIKGNRVQLALQAPASVEIVRGELPRRHELCAAADGALPSDADAQVQEPLLSTPVLK